MFLVVYLELLPSPLAFAARVRYVAGMSVANTLCQWMFAIEPLSRLPQRTHATAGAGKKEGIASPYFTKSPSAANSPAARVSCLIHLSVSRK